MRHAINVVLRHVEASHDYPCMAAVYTWSVCGWCHNWSATGGGGGGGGGDKGGPTMAATIGPGGPAMADSHAINGPPD